MRRAASNFPAKSSLIVGTATAAAVSGASMPYFSDEIKAAVVGLSRSTYTIFTIASTAVDYKYSLHRLSKDSDEYWRVISEVDDVEALQKSGIDPRKVAKALVELFADMIYIHGFVHGDPHPGNILVSPNGRKGFTLVLLDHGIYKELDEGFRKDFCRLSKALILRDANEVQHIGECFGIGRYARYLPLIFTGKPINSKSSLEEGISVEEKTIVKQELKGLAMEDISSFMESLPTDFLIILRTDSILRSILSKLGVPRSVRLVTYAKRAVYGLSLSRDSKSGFTLDVLLSKLKSNLSYLQFKCILGVLGLFSWVDDIKHLSNKSLRTLFAAVRRLGFSNATT